MHHGVSAQPWRERGILERHSRLSDHALVSALLTMLVDILRGTHGGMEARKSPGGQGLRVLLFRGNRELFGISESHETPNDDLAFINIDLTHPLFGGVF